MSEKKNFEIWLAVNEDGESAISMDSASEAREALIDDCGGAVVRVAKLPVKMALPAIIEAKVDVADEAGETIEADAA